MKWNRLLVAIGLVLALWLFVFTQNGARNADGGAVSEVLFWRELHSHQPHECNSCGT